MSGRANAYFVVGVLFGPLLVAFGLGAVGAILHRMPFTIAALATAGGWFIVACLLLVVDYCLARRGWGRSS